MAAVDGIPLYPGASDVSADWALGYLPSCPGRPPAGFVNAVLDELAVVAQALTQEQVAAVWKNPSQSLLSLLGVRLRMDLPRRAYVRGEEIPLTFVCAGQGTELRLSVTDAAGREYPVETIKPVPSAYALDSNRLRPGEMRLKAVLVRDGTVLDTAETDVVVHAFRRPEFPVGVGGGWKDETVLQYYQQNHISFITGNGPAYGYHGLDRMYRYGIGYYPNLNVVEVWQNGPLFNRAKEEPYFHYDKEKGQWSVSSPECFEYLQTLVPINGKVEQGFTSSGSPFSPIAFTMMSKVIGGVMASAGDHPGLQYMSFQDEVPLRFAMYNSFDKYKKGGWQDEWHCFALTWKDDRREAFFDGKSVAQATGVPVAASIVSPVWYFGFLAPGPGAKPAGFSNAVYDDAAVLAKALSAEEAGALWQQKDKSLAEVAAATPALVGKVWAYWSFDNTLDPQPQGRAKKSVLGASMEDLAQAASALQPAYVPGKSGAALDLVPGNLLACTLDTSGFPLNEGTLLFWFKPHETWQAMQDRFLLYVSWAGFSIQTSGDRILAYYTSDNTKWLTCPELLPAIGDYCHAAVRHFEQVSGMKGPVWPPDKPAGTVFPDDEPYLKWKSVIGLPGDTTGEGFDRLYEKLSAEVKKVRPDIQTANYSGGEYGYTDAVADWQYPYIWEPRLGWGENGHGLLDFSLDLHRARQKVTPKKPLYALLGWWSDDMGKANADWWPLDFRLNTEIALAKGVKLLEWFAPGDTGTAGYLGQPEGKREFEKWCAWLHRNGPVFRHLEPQDRGTVAVLWSETNTAGKTRKSPNWPPRYVLTLTALRIAGFEPVLVTDERVEQGTLDRCGALILLDCDYSRQSVWGRIEDFARQPGKTVYYDTLSALHPEKAVALPFAYDEWGPQQRGSGGAEGRLSGYAYQAAQFRGALPVELLAADCRIRGSDQVAPYWLAGGQGRYLFLVNLNWREAQTVQFKLRAPGTQKASLYDFLSGQPAALAGTVQIGPGDWKVYILLPDAVGGIELRAKYGARSHSLDLSAQLQGTDGKDLEAPLPLAVRLFAPDNTLLPYTQPTAFDGQGAWTLAVRLADLMEKPGTYRLEVEETMTGTKALRSIVVGALR
jgi:hypothetical protein